MTDRSDDIKRAKAKRWDRFRSVGGLGWKTSSLFADILHNPDRDNAPFWLDRNKLDDKRPCFREWFLHYKDLTGQKVAMKFLGNYEHWQLMEDRCPWFREAVEQWRVELRAQLKSEAMERLQEIADTASPATSLAATKALLEIIDDKPKKQVKRGRPSKSEVASNLKQAMKNSDDTDEDFERITKHLETGNA